MDNERARKILGDLAGQLPTKASIDHIERQRIDARVAEQKIRNQRFLRKAKRRSGTSSLHQADNDFRRGTKHTNDILHSDAVDLPELDADGLPIIEGEQVLPDSFFRTPTVDEGIRLSIATPEGLVQPQKRQLLKRLGAHRPHLRSRKREQAKNDRPSFEVPDAVAEEDEDHLALPETEGSGATTPDPLASTGGELTRVSSHISLQSVASIESTTSTLPDAGTTNVTPPGSDLNLALARIDTPNEPVQAVAPAQGITAVDYAANASANVEAGQDAEGDSDSDDDLQRSLTVDQSPEQRKRHHLRQLSKRSAKPATRQRLAKTHSFESLKSEAMPDAGHQLRRRMTDLGKLAQHTPLKRRVKKSPAGSGIEKLSQVLVEAGVLDEEGEVTEIDVLYENQRGMVVFGQTKFSPNLLFQLDPSSWSNATLKNTPYTPVDFPLPNPTWSWVNPTWSIDMTGDVDYHGWQYAIRFRSGKWRGCPDVWRSFVRRRRWFRTRRKQPTLELEKKPAGEVYAPPTDLPQADMSEAEKNSWAEGQTGKQLVCLLPQSLQHMLVKRAQETTDEIAQPWLSSADVRQRMSESDHGFAYLYPTVIGELNLRRACKTLAHTCSLDRHRLKLWKIWLRDEEAKEVELPDLVDAFELMRQKLDALLLVFDYNTTRRAFLQLVKRRATEEGVAGSEELCQTIDDLAESIAREADDSLPFDSLIPLDHPHPHA
ncbi:uncharacterized protein L969DRAFT_96194 [Mixia osmundae IAM 14324]|uniref:Peroxin/Ferlin domain-containing protein n=1 Tax=Mixia osmundae (strain CBS 9802 / IAM 14324 / JCM 22182 / KY 12970) TaxID=764103 RepID=G7E4P9_MIXOS|nr:uncharacterized protein L969DRAFT_96194 [Mixia osmundae IAM 14324]KEI37673.1 hypothetical protein L969DRAFT_96194 [Mixia osmundae IAM 14324]GAA97809.1 hypothetical protein E5Q_04488 [Mixia osmundae IAM 14324]